MGNTLVGKELNHSLKEGWVFSLPALVSIASQILSRLPIQLGDKWQFYKNTQVPLFCASSIAFSACTPCPCPKEIVRIVLFFESAKLCKIDIGSVPGSRNTNGFTELDSEYERLISNVGERIKPFPSTSFIYFFTAKATCSLFSTFIKQTR